MTSTRAKPSEHSLPPDLQDLLDREGALRLALRVGQDDDGGNNPEHGLSQAGAYLNLVRVLAAHQSLPLLWRGECLGGFEVTSFLARGGSGQVFRARQPSVGNREVALKVVALGTISAGERRRLDRELSLAQGIHHRSLAEVYDADVDQERGLFYMAMRLVEGPTLAILLQDQRGDPPRRGARRQLVERIRDVAWGLAELHAARIIHRDVKPANIILETADSGEPGYRHGVLVDFGLIRSVEGTRTATGSVRATPEYAAPEQLLGVPLQPSSDTFSLGVCLHDVLAGRTPDDRSLPSVRPLEPLHRLVRDLDPELEAIVAKATEREPSFRYPSAAELAMDLTAWLDGKPVRAPSPRGLGQLRRWVRHHPGRALRWGARGMILTTGVLLLGLGALQVRKVAADVQLAKKSFSVGDFSNCLEAVRTLPEPLLPMLSTPGPRDALRPPRERESTTPLQAVFQILEDQGLEAGLTHACRWLEAEGLPRHPHLASFLTHSLLHQRDGALRAFPSGSSPFLLAARLWTERPDRSPEESRASAPARQVFRSVLQQRAGAGRADDTLYALTALAGSGLVEDIPLLGERVTAVQNLRSEAGAEELRLLLHGQAAIIRRAQACETLSQLLDGDLDAVLRQAVGAVDRMKAGLGDGDAGLGEACLRLFLEVNVALRAAGLPPSQVTLPTHLRQDQVRLLAVRRDRSLLDRLTSAALIPVTFDEFKQVADWVGLMDDPVLAESLEQHLPEWAAAAGCSLEEAEQAWRAGLGKADDTLHGRPGEASPDPDTHLGWTLSHPQEAPEETLEPDTIPLDLAGGKLAAWDFQEDVVAIGGPRTSVVLHGVPRQAGDRVGGFWPCGYARLAPYRQSDLQLSFDWPEGLGRDIPLEVVIQAQKANRATFPYSGVATLEVELGETKVGEFRLSSAGMRLLTCPLDGRRADEAGRVTLTVACGPASTTTSRIAWVAVRHCAEAEANISKGDRDG